MGDEVRWVKRALLIALLLRIAVIALGCFIDSSFEHLQFTDVDYLVYSDAAKHITEGRSPYERPSYRYSPMLAWLLTGNVFVHPSFGKIVFAVFDVACVREIWAIQSILHPDRLADRRWWLWVCALNPFSVIICCRGSCDAISNFLVLLAVRALLQPAGPQLLLSALSYALAAHLRVYPLIYLPCLLLALRPRWADAALFLAISITAMALLAYLSGELYVQHALLHHLGRVDHRHNLSAYWPLLWLQPAPLPLHMTLLPFALQCALLLAIPLAGLPLPLGLLLQTMVFVMLNKVITAQYFLWGLVLLPLTLSKDQLLRPSLLGAVCLWALCLALWLLTAYRWEFLGHACLQLLGLAGMLFLLAQALLAVVVTQTALT